MRLLADENVPLPSVNALRDAGHDVIAIAESDPGAGDIAVLARARDEQRFLVTFDRDFGELVFRRGHAGPPGIVFLRFRPAGPTEPGDVLLALIGQAEIQLKGFVTVVDRTRARQRRMPASPSDG